MEPKRSLARAGYLVAILLFAIPLVDITLALVPLGFADAHWRWGAVGRLSALLLVPMIGIFVAIAVSTMVGDRRVKRTIGAICAVLAIALLIMSGFFVLDYFQISSAVAPQMRRATALASIVAGVKNVLWVVVLALCSRACLSQAVNQGT